MHLNLSQPSQIIFKFIVMKKDDKTQKDPGRQTHDVDLQKTEQSQGSDIRIKLGNSSQGQSFDSSQGSIPYMMMQRPNIQVLGQSEKTNSMTSSQQPEYDSSRIVNARTRQGLNIEVVPATASTGQSKEADLPENMTDEQLKLGDNVIQLGLEKIEEGHSFDEQSQRGSVRQSIDYLQGQHIASLQRSRSNTSSCGNKTSRDNRAFDTPPSSTSDRRPLGRGLAKHVTSSQTVSEWNKVTNKRLREHNDGRSAGSLSSSEHQGAKTQKQRSVKLSESRSHQRMPMRHQSQQMDQYDIRPNPINTNLQPPSLNQWSEDRRKSVPVNVRSDRGKMNKSGMSEHNQQTNSGTLNIDEKQMIYKAKAARGRVMHKLTAGTKSVKLSGSPSFTAAAGTPTLPGNPKFPDPEDDYSDTMSGRLRKKLDKEPKAEDTKKQMHEKLDDSASIDGDIKDVQLEDGPQVRKYLDKYADRIKRNDWRKYSQDEVKDHDSLKSILTQRSQFNDTKREFHNQLQKKFIVHEAPSQSKEGLPQERSKRSSIGSGEKSKRDVEISRFNLFKRFNKDYDQKMLAIKDEVTFMAHGLEYKLSKNSLGFLNNKHKFRIILVWFVTWKPFDHLILLLIILNSMCLGGKDYLDPLNKTEWNQWIDSFEPYFTVAFCIECVMKILAYGFIIGKKAYLKEAWNWLDFIVVIVSLLEQYIPNASGLRTFRLFRPLRSLNNVKSMQILVETLFLSLLSLGGIMALALFFFTIFSILGISQWRGLTHWRCRQTEFPVDGDWLTVEDDTQLCYIGQRECPVGWCGSLLERHDSHDDLWNVDNLKRDSQLLELNYGVTNFDNLGYAFITIFQCITMEGWTTVMYIFQDVANNIFVTFYFMSCVVICSFFLLNLTIAVMLMQYDELEQRNSDSIHRRTLRDIGLSIAKLPRPLVDFIIKQSNLQIGKGAKKQLKKLESKEMTFCQKLIATDDVNQIIEQNSYYQSKIPRFFLYVAKSNLFGILVMVCIILNTLVLSMDRFPEGEKQEMETLAYFNMCFNVVFTAEVLIKMIGLGLTRYIKNVENIFDLFVVTMSWVELGLGAEGGSSLGALRAVRLFRVFKLFKSGDLRILMDSIVFTISTIGPYTVLLMLFLYVFALMGMQFFAGQFRFMDHGIGVFDMENGEVPRANFDTLKDALLTTFGCFIGDNWTYVMYDAIRSSGSIYALFYVIVISFGNIVMLNLFLAILLGNFDKARDFGAKKKLLHCFEDLKLAGYDQSQCIDLILDDTAEYCKVSILKWDRRVVGLERAQPSVFLRSMLQLNAQFMDRFGIELQKKYEREDESDSEGDENGSDSSARKLRKQHMSKRSLRSRKKNQKSRRDTSMSNISKFSAITMTAKAIDRQGTIMNKPGLSAFNQQAKLLNASSSESKIGSIGGFNQASHQILPSPNSPTDYGKNSSSPREKESHGSSVSVRIEVQPIGQKQQQTSSMFFEQQEAEEEPDNKLFELYNEANDTNRCIEDSHIGLIKYQEQNALNQNSSECETQREAMNSDRVMLPSVQDPTSCDQIVPVSNQQAEQLALPDSNQYKLNQLAVILQPMPPSKESVVNENAAAIGLEPYLDGLGSSAYESPEHHLLNVSSPSPLKQKFSLMRSVRSIFSKKQNKLEVDDVEQLKNVLKKVLKPSGHTVKRGKEITNLKALIAESEKYQVEREDYHLHDNDDDQGQIGISQWSAMKAQSEDPTQLVVKQQQLSATPQFINSTRGLASAQWFQASSPVHVAELNDNLSPLQSPGTPKLALPASRNMRKSLSAGKRSMILRRKMLASGVVPGLVDKKWGLDLNENHEEFQEDQRRSCRQKYCSAACWHLVRDYMRESSLLFIHKDFRLRQWCIKLLEPQPDRADNEEGPNFSMTESKLAQTSIGKANKLAASLTKMKGSVIIKADVEEDRKMSGKRRSTKRKKRSDQSQIAQRAMKKGCCRGCMQSCCPSLLTMPPNKWFDTVILLLIFTSSVMLALDNPLNDPNSLESKVYRVIDLVHTVLFTGEMLIKIIGLGFFTNRLNNPLLAPYVHSTWNCLDFFVVMSSLAEIFLPYLTGGGGADSLKSLKALRALRALRPLRMVSKNEGMKLVVGALMTSIPSMTNVLVVCLLLLLILAIVGVNLFKGAFYFCDGLTYDQTLAIITKQDCLLAGGAWLNNEINFDNVINAMVTLFQMMTTEGWISVMYNGIDAVGVDMQPKKDNNPIMAMYFVAFMIIGSQFIINLFVGVVIDNFNKIKEKDEMGNCFVTQEQRSWIEIQKVCLSKNLIKEMRRPKGYQITFTKMTENPVFEYIITGCILANTIAMAMVSYREASEMTQALEILNYFFAVVFNFEMILKLLAQGKSYFRQGWNIFDCFIVFGTNFGVLMKVIGAGASMGATTSVIRGFRIMRIFRLVKASISMRLLIDTLMNILPQITNIMSLMGILLFIYAALGTNLFSQVIYQEQLYEKNNFRTFGQAMILLMRCATGEDWNLIMYELANTTGYKGVECRDQDFKEREAEGTLGCGSTFSYVFFFSFIVIITMLIMNLAVAAVIQGLNTACAENLGIVSSDDINNFIELWKYYDPGAFGWIGADSLIYLLFELDAPLGRKKEEIPPEEKEEYQNADQSADRYLVHKDKQIVLKKKKAIEMLRDNLQIKMHKDKKFAGDYKVHYMDVLRGLLKRILNEKKQEYKLKGEVEGKIAKLWNKKFKDLQKHQDDVREELKKQDYQGQMTAAQLQAVRIIETWYNKKRCTASSKPDVKVKHTTEDLDRFKEAKRKLALARAGKPKSKAELAAELESNIAKDGRMNAKEFADKEVVDGGRTILHIIEQMNKKDPKLKKKVGQASSQARDRATKKTHGTKNNKQQDSLSWTNENFARQLAKEVEEEQNLEKLMQHKDGKGRRMPKVSECSDLRSSYDDNGFQSDSIDDMTQNSLGEASIKRSNTLEKAMDLDLNSRLEIPPRRQNSDQLSGQLKPNEEDFLSPKAGGISKFPVMQQSAKKIVINNLDGQSFGSAPDKDDDDGEGENNMGKHLLKLQDGKGNSNSIL